MDFYLKHIPFFTGQNVYFSHPCHTSTFSHASTPSLCMSTKHILQINGQYLILPWRGWYLCQAMHESINVCIWALSIHDSNTSLLFLPGEHILTNHTEVMDTEEFSMVPYYKEYINGPETARIKLTCIYHKHYGGQIISFNNVSHVKIDSISFHSCGSFLLGASLWKLSTAVGMRTEVLQSSLSTMIL